MPRSLLLLFLLLLSLASGAQTTFRATVKNDEGETLAGATVQWSGRSSAADSSGSVVLYNIPAGTHRFTLSFVGYTPQTLVATFPLPADSMFTIVLVEDEAAEEEAVVVQAMRTSRSIANTPTRIEVISGEELAEKGNMKPGDIRMLLNESTGIQTQQTSATSYGAGIRIQGLDGRYTQLLRDGYPLYSGFAGGLSILQVAPLDLQQVEVIKGSASTLYGGGAIAGLVNLVSKTPGPKRVLDILANGTSAGGLDLSAFYSERYKRSGLTLYAARNSTAPYDPAGNGFTALPKSERYTVSPRLFLYGTRTTADIGLSYSTEDRSGGHLATIRHGGNGFVERNQSSRGTVQAGITQHISDHSSLQLKNSYSLFDRRITIPGYAFDARQRSSFSELTWMQRSKKLQWVLGANLLTDNLRERPSGQQALRDYHYTTLGIFVQNTWSPVAKLTLESGLRADHISQGYGLELLPRLSALYRISTNTTMRLGGGLGYKTPTIFTEEAERLQFRNVLPIGAAAGRNERSAGISWDVNYRKRFGNLGFSANTLLFYTRLNRPLVLLPTGSGSLEFRNANGRLDSRGAEVNLRFLYGAFKLFVGYTYTNAQVDTGTGRTALPLTAKHRLNNVLVYELHEKWKIGLEGYYYSRQQLTDGSTGRAYWIAGLMAERSWKSWALFVNFENIGDTRQTRSGPVVTGTAVAPVFGDIYAPLDGFVVNCGIKIRF
ncbi:TonB-dependent receptor [Flaviaesturariibacter terrae]